MTDSSLDDFFAKKDKSKKKSKSKQTPSDILEKLDDKPKKEKKKRDKDKTQTVSGASQGVTKTIEDEDEWLDFQEESEKDYSGLRIQNLQIAKEEEEEQEESEGGEEREDGETREKQSITSGVWAVSGPAQPPVSGTAPALGVGETSEPAPPPPKPKEEATKIVGKYIPPGARSSLSGGGSNPVVSTQQIIRRKKEAPNIKSEVDFPTLGGMGKSDAAPDTSDEANYEHPGRGRTVQLSLENKFAALQD